MKKRDLIYLGIIAVLLIGNFWQFRVNQNEKQANLLALGESRVLIEGKLAEIRMRDSLISTIRKERVERTAKDSVSMAGLKTRVAVLRGEIAKLPTVIPYNPDTLTIDSLRTAFVLKDSVIDTQALMIMNLETEKESLFNSFTREVQQLTDQRSDQVEISNTLQDQLIEQQKETRKEKRKKKFFRTLSVIGAAGIWILLLKP
jgi:hypothetical protein